MVDIEVTGTDFLDIFIGRQNIDNISVNGGDISFDVCDPDLDAEIEMKQDPHRTITQSDLEDIESFFADSLQSHPFAKHLLQILWIREVKFSMRSLKDDDVYDFIQGAFTLYGIELDEETIENEFFELLYEGYLQETNSGFFLAPKGRRVAEALFEALKSFVPTHDETPAMAVTGDGIAQLAEALAEISKRKNSIKTGNRRKKISKYEVAVGKYLRDLVNAVKIGDQTQEFAVKLKPIDIAKALHTRGDFNGATIESIKEGVRHSKAWRNKHDILKQIDGIKPLHVGEVYDKRTFKKGKNRPDHVNEVDCNVEYEAPVEKFLSTLHNKVLLGEIKPEKYCQIAVTLTPKAVAIRIKEDDPAFGKRSIATIENGVLYSKAWINREEILDTETYTK